MPRRGWNCGKSLAADPYAHGEPAGSVPPSAISGPQANFAPDNKATVQGANSQINTVEIAQRVNQELGINLEITTAGWKRDWTAWKAILLVRVFAILSSIDFATSCCGVVPRVQEVPKASGTLFPRQAFSIG